MNKWTKRCCELNYGDNKMNTIICFVATDKHSYLEEQVDRYKPYFKDVFIMIDKCYDDLELPYLQVKHSDTNYKNVFYTSKTKCKDSYSSWSKSLEYFKDLNADNIWFIEYDVFIPNVDMLLSLNKNKEHLLVKDNIPYTGKRGEWSHWRQFKRANITDFGENWFHSMTCMCRLSKDLLRLIHEFSKTHNKLFFHEILFNTLAENHNLSIKLIDELEKVIYMGNHKKNSYELTDVSNDYIYHPVKDLDLQRIMYDSLNPQLKKSPYYLA